MSWDVIAFKRTNELLGSAAKVRTILSRHLKGADWSDPTNGIYFGDGFSFELWLGDQDPLQNIIFGVRGSGDPLPVLVAIAKAEGWALLDCSSSEELDLEAPSGESWTGYQELIKEAHKDMRRRGLPKGQSTQEKGQEKTLTGAMPMCPSRSGGVAELDPQV